MSKRDVTSEQSIFVLGLRDLGYMPEAVNNWIALMGASFGAEEVLLSLDEMIARFSLEHLTPSAARVNFEKLDHFNGLYLRQLEAADLAARVKPFFELAGLHPDDDTLLKVVPLIQQRIVTLDDAVDMSGFFFRPAPQPAAAEFATKGLTPEQCRDALRQALDLLEEMPAGGFTHENLEPPMRALAEQLGLKPGQLFGLLRVAITGQSVSPPLFESMVIIGREPCRARVAFAIKQLS